MKNIIFAEVTKQALKERAAGYHGDTLASVPFIHSSGTKASEGVDVGYLLNALECYKDENILISFRDSLIQVNRGGFQTNIIMGMRL